MSTPHTTDRTMMRRVVGASLIGTTIEWYDFFAYGTAALLVFNSQFFPDYAPAMGTILALGTYAVGFAARPLGGLIFGHFGDRVGRKRMLIVTLLLMGVATFAIGLLPTYASLGVWAPIMLVALRLLQGVAVGGEWGGAVLMVAEHGDPRRRGLWSSWPQAGVPAGNLLSVGVFAAMTALMSRDDFESWGWRVPFLLSALLVAVGLYIRVSISESPAFSQIQSELEQKHKRRAPLVVAVRRYWRQVLVAMGARFAENISYYVFTVFVLEYVERYLGLDRQTGLTAVLIASAVHFAVIPLWGAASDRFGRKPIYLVGAVGVLVWGFGFFILLDTESPVGITAAVTVGLVFHAAMYGPQAAYFSEMFGTGVRYTGASIGYQLASVFAGGFAPMIAVALLNGFDSSIPVSLYLVGAALVTLVSVAVFRETAKRDLTADSGL